MNVYDFDETIYKGDSTRDFIFYIIKKRPIVWINIFKQCGLGILYLLKLIKKTEFKENLYSTFKLITDMDELVEEFVNVHMKNIKPWYLAQKREDDLIISASPMFLVKRFCDKLDIKNVMASNVNINTGKYTGENCYGEEKVKRYFEKYTADEMENFYSDSYSDQPLAKLGRKAFIVKGDELIIWDFKKGK